MYNLVDVIDHTPLTPEYTFDKVYSKLVRVKCSELGGGGGLRKVFESEQVKHTDLLLKHVTEMTDRSFGVTRLIMID